MEMVSEDSEAVPRPFQWPTIAEALADDYSSKMVDEFLAILRESADRGCLAQPGAVPPSRQRAADLLMRYGQRVLDLRAREADDQAILDYMARTEGPGFSSELSALVRHPKVIEMIELNRPAWLAIAADEVANALDMYLVVTQIRLTRKLSALSTFTGTLYDEFTKIIDARSASTTALLDANPDAPQLSRFDDLLMRWEEARMKVRDPNAEPPYRAFEGVARDLELMCVRSR
jgi:hypothetical protein